MGSRCDRKTNSFEFDSRLHIAEQPSPLIRFPSSHSSSTKIWPEAKRLSADLSSHIFTPSPKTSIKHELLLVVKMPLPHGFRSGVEPDGVVTGAGDGVVAPIVAAIATLVVSARCAALVVIPARALVVTLLYACGVVDGIG